MRSNYGCQSTENFRVTRSKWYEMIYPIGYAGKLYLTPTTCEALFPRFHLVSVHPSLNGKLVADFQVEIFARSL